MAAGTAFVSYPSHIGAVIVVYDGVRLIFADKLEISVEIVLLTLAGRCFAVCLVKPDLENLAVACQ